MLSKKQVDGIIFVATGEQVDAMEVDLDDNPSVASYTFFDQEKAFEEVWKNRDTHLAGVPGFQSFALLKGPEREDHTL